MPWAKDGSSFYKHTHIEHRCKCGKVVKGNSFYNHTKHCKVWLEWRNSPERESSRLITNPFGIFYKE